MKVFLTLFIPAWVIGATISAMGLLEFSTHFTEMHACGASQPQAGRGVIINDSSVSAKVGFPTISPYNASKHCIASLTKVAALERATAQRNGRELDMDCCSMYTLREGKIAELHVLPFDAARWNEFWS
jgi:hypothetical protein